MYAFVRDKDSRERTSLSLAVQRVWPRRLRFGGMRAQRVDTANANAKQYQECNTLVTRIEVRIMRLKEKGEKTKGALQATR